MSSPISSDEATFGSVNVIGFSENVTADMAVYFEDTKILIQALTLSPHLYKIFLLFKDFKFVFYF